MATVAPVGTSIKTASIVGAKNSQQKCENKATSKIRNNCDAVLGFTLQDLRTFDPTLDDLRLDCLGELSATDGRRRLA